jgi:hypothetical protein
MVVTGGGGLIMSMMIVGIVIIIVGLDNSHFFCIQAKRREHFYIL